MIKVFVPKDNVNDDEVVVVSVNYVSNSSINKGDCIFEVETSKTVLEIDAPASGKIMHSISVGDIIKVGSLLCKIDEKNKKPTSRINYDENKTHTKNQSSTKKENIKISKAAKKRAMDLGVDTSIFKKGMVSISDIEEAFLAQKEKKSLKATGIKRSNNKILIIGGGGHAKMCIDLLRKSKFEIIGIIDNKLVKGSTVTGIEVLGGDDILEKLLKKGVNNAVNGVGAISNLNIRKKIFLKLKKIGFYLPNIIHESAVVEPSSKFGEGNQVMMSSSVGSEAVIHDNCIINSGAIISHESVIQSHSHIAPGAVLAADVNVGETTLIGMSTTIFRGVKVGKETVIYNGVNIYRDVGSSKIIKI